MNDSELIQKIAARAAKMYKRVCDVEIAPAFIASELFIVHENICRMRLQEFLDADESNFAHDIGGIHRHLDIQKKPVLRDCFVPRFAA